MAEFKRISGDYTIQSLPSASSQGNVVINASTTTINGNLVVIGTSTNFEANNTVIYDNIITLNGGVTGTPTLNAGIEINRGTSPNVAIRWNETTHTWQITSDGTNYGNISVLSGNASNFISSVNQDPSPSLGGNLNVNTYAITSSVNNIVLAPAQNVAINSNLQLQTSAITPSAIAGYTIVYAAAPSSGNSGVYVSTTVSTGQELITKNKALVYSLVL